VETPTRGSPKREYAGPRGQPGTVLPRIPVAPSPSLVVVIVCSRVQWLLGVSSSPGVTYIHVYVYICVCVCVSYSLGRAAPGHTGFRPAEFLGHCFLRHHISFHPGVPSSFFRSVARRDERAGSWLSYFKNARSIETREGRKGRFT